MSSTSPQCYILTDSTADLSSEYYEENNVGVVPMQFMLDGTEYKDDGSISLDEFYARLENGEEASTSQTAILGIQEGLNRALEHGLPVVYFGFTSGLSSTHDRAVQVVEDICAKNPDAEIYLLDSLLASLAQGYLVRRAVELRDGGASAKEIYEWAQDALFKINGYFTLDGLEHLRRGGRIPDVAAIAGAKLDVKPILKITPDGELGFDKVTRGRKKSIKALLEKYKERHISSELHDDELIVVGGAGAPEDVAMFEELVRKEAPNARVVCDDIGPVIGSHVGPGMVAIVFEGVDRRSKAQVERAERKAEKIIEKAERKAEREEEKVVERIEKEFERAAKKQ